MPVPGPSSGPGSAEVVSVPIGQWAVVLAPVKLRTLLGSCVGVVLHDRVAALGALAHVVLPDSRGATDHPGKYADTAIPAMIADIERRLGVKARGRLIAKLAGGARMFGVGGTNSALNIGQLNCDAVERILSDLRIPIVARDLGGASGRHLTLDTASGIVAIKIPGGTDHEI